MVTTRRETSLYQDDVEPKSPPTERMCVCGLRVKTRGVGVVWIDNSARKWGGEALEFAVEFLLLSLVDIRDSRKGSRPFAPIEVD